LSRLLLLSNGHGEDLSGALLGRQLLARGLTVEALPLVGHGHPYRQAGIPVISRTREFSTGGLGYTSLAGRITELREGQYLDVVRRLLSLRGRRDRLIVAAALGLGALMTAAPQVFRLLTYAGALYLVWLGGKSFLAAFSKAGSGGALSPRDGSPLLQGFSVQIANPKALLFFSAVLPPFLDLHRPIVPQMVMFAAATMGLDLITMTTYGLGGVALANRMTAPGFRRGFNLCVGLILMLAAILIVTRH
jgi:threonine/homoserine/homoserine lactone efflux protein